MAKKSLLDTLTPKTSAAELDLIAEQIHGLNTEQPAAPSPKTPAKQSKSTAPPSPTPPAEVENVQHRLTIDLPKWLVEQIRQDGKKNGVTVRGIILGHLLNIYKEN